MAVAGRRSPVNLPDCEATPLYSLPLHPFS
jgi:hypothetical protein